MSRPRRTSADIDAAKLMRAQGKSWTEIGKALGFDRDSVHGWLDRRFAERRYEQCKRRLLRYENEDRRQPRARPIDVAARLAEIPKDDRDLTQRLMGDPLPARSALAMKKIPGKVSPFHLVRDSASFSAAPCDARRREDTDHHPVLSSASSE